MSRGRAIRMSFHARIFSVVPFCFAFLLTSTAQRGGLNDPRPLQDLSTSYDTAPGTGVLVFTVFSERSSLHLDRQALLKLVNLANQTATWQTTEDTSQGVFTNIPYGSYDVEASAVGYISMHKELQVMNSLRPLQIDIVLHRDPAANNLDVANFIMSQKARKETQRAVSALKSERYGDAQKHLDEAYKTAPSDPNLNFLQGYLYFQKKDFVRAAAYLGTATSLNPHNSQALTLLGRAGLERQDYPAARSALEQAVLADAENWLPHNLLADAYLREKNYDRARDEAEVAITKGKTAASPAELVLGQALLNLGHEREGIQALNVFLEESPRQPVAGQVRELIAEIQREDVQRNEVPREEGQPHDSTPTQTTASTNTTARLSGVDPLLALPETRLSVKSWQPPSIDDVKPSLAGGVECPLDRVIDESGKRVQQFVDDLARFSAVEDIFHQALDEYGNPIRTETRKYNYVASISEPQPGSLAVDEYRADKISLSGYPDRIASTGFATLALVFHPHMRDTFAITCEGLGDWRGQASWLVRFRQRDDRPNHMHSYKVGNDVHPVSLKGRAWITADKFQIVRIEAEMLSPMPEIQLLSEHQVVEYGPVPFAKKNTSLWLPKSAEIYFDFRRHRYYRRHSFDHYMLFAIDSEEKRKEPVATPDKKADSSSENKSE
jgi:tetratricopeptide (TPR) repeat protein